MAKISARGAHKVASASKRWSDDDGYEHKLRLALRSDGKILRAHDLLLPTMAKYGSRGWNRGAYSIAATIKAGADPLAVFTAYAARNGCALD